MQYCSLQHRTLLLSPVTSSTEYCFCFGFIPSFFLEFSPLISSSILGAYRPGEFPFQYPIILPFHTVHRVLKARILKWYAIPFSSGPRFVIRLHHDLSFLEFINILAVIFLLFHTVHGFLKARILKCFVIPFSSGPHFVRTLHHDPSFFMALHGMA